MKRVVFLFTVLFLGAALGEAIAQCTRGTRVTDIQAALDNQFVCAITTNGTDTWSEEHGPGNLLSRKAKRS